MDVVVFVGVDVIVVCCGVVVPTLHNRHYMYNDKRSSLLVLTTMFIHVNNINTHNPFFVYTYFFHTLVIYTFTHSNRTHCFNVTQ